MLEEERGEISRLDQDVLDSLRENELVATNLNAEIAEQRTYADVMADRIATFGGSWRFVLVFIGVMIVWITINSLALFGPRFDPVSVHPSEPRALMHCRSPGANHHDEPESPGEA